MLAYLYGRLKEASTWRGVLAILTAAGVTLQPEQQNAIVAAGLSLIGLVGVFFSDKLGK